VQHYSDNDIPKEIIVPRNPDDASISKYLIEKRNGNVTITVPGRGDGCRRKRSGRLAAAPVRGHRDPASCPQPGRHSGRGAARERNPLCSGRREILLCAQRSVVRDHPIARTGKSE